MMCISNIDIGSDFMARAQFKNLTEPMYYILLSLNEERHGYDIMQFIDEFTNGRVKVGAGTLYNLLSRFQNEGIISLILDDGRKKTYKLTTEGERFLEDEHKRLKMQINDGEGIINSGANKEKTIRNVVIKKIKDEDLFF